MAANPVALRGRLDLSKETEPEERILDHLAKLLANGCGSICVAVAIIDGKLNVTANEFHAGTRVQGQKIKDIRKILMFFKGFSNTTAIPSQEEQCKMFEEICCSVKQNSGSSPYSQMLGENFKTLLTKYVLVGKTPTVKQFQREFGANYKIAWDAYINFQALFRSFTVVIQALTATSAQDAVIYSPIIGAFKSFRILTEEQNKEVHAELKILSNLFEKHFPSTEFHDSDSSNDDDGDASKTKLAPIPKQQGSQEIYLGISKLCCLGCRVMLEESNEFFNSKGIILKFRGRHDLSFEGSWQSPQIFERGYQAEGGISSSSVAFQIGQRTKRRIKELRGISILQVRQSPEPTLSESSSPHGEISSNTNGLAGILNSALEALAAKSTEKVEGHFRKLFTLINLLKTTTFQDMLSNPDLIENPLIQLPSIHAEMLSIDPAVTEAEIKEILHDSELVGTHISGSFLRSSAFQLTSQAMPVMPSVGHQSSSDVHQNVSVMSRDQIASHVGDTTDVSALSTSSASLPNLALQWTAVQRDYDQASQSAQATTSASAQMPEAISKSSNRRRSLKLKRTTPDEPQQSASSLAFTPALSALQHNVGNPNMQQQSDSPEKDASKRQHLLKK